MDVTVLVSLAPLLDARLSGAEVARALPCGSTGVHVELRGVRPGLRVDARPGTGAVLLMDRRPPRIKGGRGAWPEIAAVADRSFSGQSVVAVRVDPRGPSLSIVLSDGGALALRSRGTSGAVHVLQEGEPSRVAGKGAAADSPPDPSAGMTPAKLAAAVRVLFDAPEPARLHELRVLLPFLTRREARRLVSGAAIDDASALTPELFSLLLRRISGEDGATWIDGPPGLDPGAPARASWAESLAIDVLRGEREAGGPDAVRFPGLLPAVEAWYEMARAAEALAERRERLVRLVRRERRRVTRALAAVDRDETKAADPVRLRRDAEALLCADRSTVPDGDGAFRIPDPYEPETILVIPAEPPGAPAPAVAERLFVAARRQERGCVAREGRRRELRSRIDATGAAGELAARAETEPEVAAAEDRAEELGLSLALESRDRSAAGPLRRSRPGERPARRFVSPGGLEVLVGRSARQNDRLTFKVAAPEDLWLHVGQHAGAHVVLRTAGRRGEPPEADLLFAAGLAAAYSRAPQGEAVDVHVARRKHLRRPKGGVPGLVLVRKGRTVRVRVSEPPREV